MASRTRRRLLLTLLIAALFGFAFTPAADDDGPDEAPQTQPAPQKPSSPYNEPPRDQPYLGDDGRCPFVPDFCRERFLYNTSLGGDHAASAPGARGAPGSSAPLPGASTEV